MKKLGINPGILLLLAAAVILVVNKKAGSTPPGGTAPPLTPIQQQRLWLVNYFTSDARKKNIFQSIMTNEEIDTCYVFYHDYNDADDYPDWLRNTMEVLNSKYNLFS